MTTTTTTLVKGEATYKGRRYAVLYEGRTTYGRRAKLAFRDLTKEFWVDFSEISNLELFNPAVDPEDYINRPGAPKTAKYIPEEREQPEETLPSYCQYCGQEIH